jgi:hypothetical protein
MPKYHTWTPEFEMGVLHFRRWRERQHYFLDRGKTELAQSLVSMAGFRFSLEG